MAIISVRYNDESKAKAEEIANAIGLSLSNAVSIFLNRFIAEKGFPFDVTVPKQDAAFFDKDELEKAVLNAIKSADTKAELPKSAYIDSYNNIKLTDTKG